MLPEEGNPQSTVEEIAARASVAPRTVFQHYADREALFAAVSAQREARLQALMGTIDPEAPLAERIAEVVAQRARVFEWIAAVRRGALLMEPFSESVHASLESFRAAKRAELMRVFACEIAQRPARARRAGRRAGHRGHRGRRGTRCARSRGSRSTRPPRRGVDAALAAARLRPKGDRRRPGRGLRTRRH